MKKVKMGIVGLGNIGTTHMKYLSTMSNVDFVAACDFNKERADAAAKTYGCTAYYNHEDMLNNSDIEAVIISVPHYDHVGISIDSFLEKGIHVLCEKPITVHINGAKKMIDNYEKAKAKNPGLVFGIMFNERTYPHFMKIKEIINGGQLGKIVRVTWINTAWFRSQAYYDSGGWRATWSGEGGGILTNQCPHTLDMYQWLFGLPQTVNGFAHIGKYHDIEVEDEVTAYMEHECGMIGHLIVSTAECPGTNRLEIVGENGTLIYEKDKITFYRNKQSMLEYSKTTKSGFAPVEHTVEDIAFKFEQVPSNHQLVTEKFVETILTGKDALIAHGPEGLSSVMLANAIMMSSFEKKAMRLPMDGDGFEKKLQELIAGSKVKK